LPIPLCYSHRAIRPAPNRHNRLNRHRVIYILGKTSVGVFDPVIHDTSLTINHTTKSPTDTADLIHSPFSFSGLDNHTSLISASIVIFAEKRKKESIIELMVR
jgi:hypothetical protein